MHERTERAIARLLFVFCCAIPTVLTMVVILVTWTPWYHQHQLQSLATKLSNDTGLIVTIEDFRRISPSKTVLQNILLVEPETGHEVARVREVTWLTEGDRVGILLQQPEIQSSQLQHAWHLVHERFLCRPEKTLLPIQLSASSLTIRGSTGSLTRNVDAWIKPVADAIEAYVECVPAMRSDGSPIKISVRRDRGGSAPTTKWTLETGEAPLPCSVIADYLPDMRRFGPDAEFAGVLEWETDSVGHWTIALGGSRFIGVDLSRLCESMPHRLTGLADIHLDRCYIDPRNTISVAGSVHARHGGYVGRSLLKAMNEHLGVVIHPELLQGPPTDVFYQMVAMHFQIKDSEMKLDGICNHERGYETLPPGVVICANRQAIAQSSNRTLRSTRMMSVVSPPHSELVPVSNQTQGWMNLLIAPSDGLPTTHGMAPMGRIRSVRSHSEDASKSR